MFASLNVLPKKTFATDYSYRTDRTRQPSLLQGWVKALGLVMFPAAEGFSLDFHPIPYRGDPSALDRHFLPRRDKAGSSVLTFFALEQSSRCLCYANANLTRTDQHGEEIMRSGQIRRPRKPWAGGGGLRIIGDWALEVLCRAQHKASKATVRRLSMIESSSCVGQAGGDSAPAVVGVARLGSYDADLDAPRRHLGVFLLAHEIDLGGADIGVPGELPHLVHRGPIPDGVVDRRLAQRMDADAPAAQPRGIDAGGMTSG